MYSDLVDILSVYPLYAPQLKPAQTCSKFRHQDWQVTQLCYEVDVEPYARARDQQVARVAADAGVLVSAHVSHTLYVRCAWNG